MPLSRHFPQDGAQTEGRAGTRKRTRAQGLSLGRGPPSPVSGARVFSGAILRNAVAALDSCGHLLRAQEGRVPVGSVARPGLGLTGTCDRPLFPVPFPEQGVCGVSVFFFFLMYF